ncbi:MAG: lamin tail domain-containing protein, partial [Prevotellaceae bacterium]|nr:lamin tail domain-containing protein [Prevotellaceae bacterium]
TTTLTFLQNFEKGVVYTLQTNNITDLEGNEMLENEFKFGIPETLETGDLIINEIMFDSNADSDDYIEIYNRSDKILDLTDVSFVKTSVANPVEQTIPAGTVVFPRSYIAFAANPAALGAYFSVPAGSRIEAINFGTFFTNDGATIQLIKDDALFDELTYSSKWHHPLIASVKGVALERINPGVPTQSPDSWHSASSETNYGTPGYKNSQYVDVTSSSESRKIVWTEPEVFSPDNDGTDDVCAIHYNTGETGYAANIIIFNAAGERVYQLASNALLQPEGFFLWDGSTDRGTNVNPGIYVIFFQAFNPATGKRIESKTPVAVSSR